MTGNFDNCSQAQEILKNKDATSIAEAWSEFIRGGDFFEEDPTSLGRSILDAKAQIKLLENNCGPEYAKGILDHPEEELLKKSLDWISSKVKNAVKNVKDFFDDIQAPTTEQMQTFRHLQGKRDTPSNILETIKQKPQSPYNHPDVNYDPTKRVDNQGGRVLKQASTQGNQPPAASKPFGRQPVFQSPNNAAIGTALGGGAAAGAAVTGVLYQEAAAEAGKVTLTVTGKIVTDGAATGYAASIQGTSAWSAATNAISSAWSAASTAIGNVISWVGGAISSMATAVAGAVAAVAGAIAGAVVTAASAIGGAIASAIAWIAALAFPW